MVQHLTLKHAARHPDLLGRDTRGTLSALSEAGLLEAGDGRTLADALDLWQGLQGLLALTIEGEITSGREQEISAALKQDLIRAAGGAPAEMADFEALKENIRARAETVYALFRKLIEDPAAALTPPDAKNEKDNGP